MRINKIAAAVFGIFLTAGVAASILLPEEERRNKEAEIKIGAGDDISGVLMDETVRNLSKEYEVTQSLESSSFQDCCSNTAQWALNAKEINVGFYCTHIAKHTVEQNQDVELYGPVIMNGETIVYKKDWEKVGNLAVTQGREQSKALAQETYPQIQGFNEITQKGILYAVEDEQVDAAILDVTKAAQVQEYKDKPLSGTDYISYVLVVEKEFEQTEEFERFLKSYNRAASRLNDKGYLAEVLGVEISWLDNKNIKFLTLEETGED